MNGWLREERSDLAAERILDAAAELFGRRGVAAVGMAAVATAAGCSRATLYRYFENRGALQIAFVHRAARRIGTEIAAEVADIADPAEQVLEATLAAVRRVRSDPTLAAWFELGDAGTAVELAHASAVIEGLGAAFLGDPADPEVAQRARWLVRVIVSLLSAPGVDDADERAMLRRFVVPVVLDPAPAPAPGAASM